MSYICTNYLEEDPDALGLLSDPGVPEYAKFPTCEWVPADDPDKWELYAKEDDVVLAELTILLGNGYDVLSKFLDCATEFDADHMADAQEKALSIVEQDWHLKLFTVGEYTNWVEENQ